MAFHPKLSVHIAREIEILKKISHPNIVMYTDYYENDANIWIVMEHVAGGDLMEYILTIKQVPELEAKIIVRDIVDAMEYLHSLGITHRDLKPDNILLHTQDNILHAKVADFGLAKVVDAGTVLKTFCGTLNYLAPEVLVGGGKAAYSHGVDRWALGVLVYVTVSGLSPFDGTSQPVLTKNIVEVNVHYEHLVDLGISQQAIDFIAQLIKLDPQQRMDEYSALQHAWFTPEDDVSSQTSALTILPFRPEYNSQNVVPDSPTMMPTSPLSPEAFSQHRSQHREQFFEVSDEETTPPHVSKHTSNTKVASNSAFTHLTTDTMDVDFLANGNITSMWCLLRTLRDSIDFPDIPITSSSITIGRDRSCDIIIKDPRVSKKHCVIWKSQAEDGSWHAMIKDTSANNIFVQDVKLKHGRTAQLVDNSILYLFKDKSEMLGFQIRLFKTYSIDEEVVATQRLTLGVKRAGEDFHEVARKIKPTHYGRLLSLNNAYPSVVATGEIVFGRPPDVTGSTSFTDSRISSRHCIISKRNCVPVLVDTSLNGTWVNGQQYSYMQEVALQDRDEVVLLYRASANDPHGGVDKLGREVLIGYVWLA